MTQWSKLYSKDLEIDMSYRNVAILAGYCWISRIIHVIAPGYLPEVAHSLSDDVDAVMFSKIVGGMLCLVFLQIGKVEVVLSKSAVYIPILENY